jgi:NADH/NAD ratio-sensing transcriptional regulator Rex
MKTPPETKVERFACYLYACVHTERDDGWIDSAELAQVAHVSESSQVRRDLTEAFGSPGRRGTGYRVQPLIVALQAWLAEQPPLDTLAKATLARSVKVAFAADFLAGRTAA